MNRLLLVCRVSADIGMGHLSRLLNIAEAFSNIGIEIEFIIFQDGLSLKKLNKFKVNLFNEHDDIEDSIKKVKSKNDFRGIIFDLDHKSNFKEKENFLMELSKIKIYLIAIDSMLEYKDIMDLIWIPSISFDEKKYKTCKASVISGWNSLLVSKTEEVRPWNHGNKVLIMTGASDTTQLSNNLPTYIDKSLKHDSEIHWVQGPYSKNPNIPRSSRLSWIIHKAPEKLDEIISSANYVVTVFGVSFFEALIYQKPIVVFSPYGTRDDVDLDTIKNYDVAKVAYSPENAISQISKLMDNNKESYFYSNASRKLITSDGPMRIANEISKMIKQNG